MNELQRWRNAGAARGELVFAKLLSEGQDPLDAKILDWTKDAPAPPRYPLRRAFELGADERFRELCTQHRAHLGAARRRSTIIRISLVAAAAAALLALALVLS